ncbi:hypothetical protein DAPPUDRAFT_237157 [Daphnia pulex]|uniref:SAP domain-containing protein n=1 Tax=Daphnia pulex TaxID=6669 RepID=E9G368_DAPPU|nr:hypothetical protein DAPPUDRAFT_237157 [Daphnia pulex]|eukprot:EFX85722.1 hypothetical protein DAPPUDRAFT_237157 [Daphnia pulex]
MEILHPQGQALQQQPMLAQQMTVQSVALSQPALTTTHLAAQNQIGQVQLTPAIQSHQVQIPLNQAHLLLNQQLTPANCTFGQVQINQAQLANIATSQHQATTHQTYFTPSISLQQNVGIPQGTIQIQPSSLVIPTSISTSIAPPGLAMPTTLSSVQNYTTTYALSRSCVSQQQQQQATVKQRVFSGLVTKVHENFGFIDEDVIFQASVVKGTAPQVGDRVLVEASYNGSMPFKWNATRVQVIAPPVVQQQQQQPPPQKLLSSTAFNQSDITKQANRDWSIRGRQAANDYRESDSREANLVELRRRYSHMYVPSDFLNSTYWWVDSFPIHRPLPLDKPVSFHIFDKNVEPPLENTDSAAVFESSDADYAYSAKVMLLSLLPMDEFLRKCCPEDEKEDFVHPARLIRFLVGHRGKNETMAIGGPWSPSLDGADPKSDPQVLIRTAIRTCKALTGIDLSSCTQWYRMAEIRYHRVSSMKSRIESVLLFVPDVWSCVPTASQWETIVHSYMQPSSEPMEEETKEETVVDPLKEASHHSKLEPKSLKFSELKTELEARNLSSKGMRTQLIPRLTIALKGEAEEEKRKREDAQLNEEEQQQQESSREDSLPADDVDSIHRLDFVASPQILVHPSRTAKAGKFSCSLVSLSVLLDYRLEDTKEHTFEVSLFSELFNEMLMRDFGALVYRSVNNESLRKEKRDKKDDDDSERKKKKEIVKIGSNNAPLLLAYCYFDLSHANYIASKDLEDLFLTLGLQQSRAQVRKLLQKVTTDDTLRYKKLIEKVPLITKEEDDQLSETSLATSGKDVSVLEPTNGKEATANEQTSSALMLFNGVYVNVEQLLLRLEKSEESRRESEQQFKLAQNQLAICRADLNKSTEANALLCRQLETEKLRSESNTEELVRTRESLNQYVQSINKIQSISSALLSSSKGGGIKEEQTLSDSQLLEPEFLDKVEN